MSKLAAFLSTQPALVGGAAVVAVAVVGGGFVMLRDAPTPEPSVTQAAIVAPASSVPPKPSVASQPETVVEAALEPKDEEPPQPSANPAPEPDVIAQADPPKPVPPSFDEVRSEADGLTVIAGQAAPRSTVVLMLNGTEVARVDAGADGAFVAIALLEPSTDARVLTLEQVQQDVTLASLDQIILAPTPVVVAMVEPEPEPAAKPAPGPEPAQKPEPAPEPTPQVTVAEPKPSAAPQSVAQATITDPIAPKPDESAASPVVAVAEVETAKAVAVTQDPQEGVTEQPTVEIAVLKADAQGVEVINRSSAPEVMSNVAIDTISYSDLGDVLLSGRAQGQSEEVRVYLDNAPVTTLQVDPSGRWRGDLPDVDTGVYTLRVDEVDASGTVTSRVETPFKREDPDVLAAAQAEENQPVSAITVQTGATLWAIARDRYGDGTLYVRVVQANADTIKNPDLIYPGQVFDLPRD